MDIYHAKMQVKNEVKGPSLLQLDDLSVNWIYKHWQLVNLKLLKALHRSWWTSIFGTKREKL